MVLYEIAADCEYSFFSDAILFSVDITTGKTQNRRLLQKVWQVLEDLNKCAIWNKYGKTVA